MFNCSKYYKNSWASYLKYNRKHSRSQCETLEKRARQGLFRVNLKQGRKRLEKQWACLRVAVRFQKLEV